jgi:hypothetical protein
MFYTVKRPRPLTPDDYFRLPRDEKRTPNEFDKFVEKELGHGAYVHKTWKNNISKMIFF